MQADDTSPQAQEQAAKPEWQSPNRAYRTPEAHETQKQRLRDWYQANKEREKQKRKSYRDTHKEEARDASVMQIRGVWRLVCRAVGPCRERRQNKGAS